MSDYKGSPCKECGEIITVYSLSGVCRKCWHDRRGENAKNEIEKIENTIERHKRHLNNYHIVRVNGIQVPEHRYIWEKFYGNLPPNWVIHHLNGLKGDNRIENLAAMPKGDHDSKALISALKARIQELEKNG